MNVLVDQGQDTAGVYCSRILVFLPQLLAFFIVINSILLCLGGLRNRKCFPFQKVLHLREVACHGLASFVILTCLGDPTSI